MKQKLAEILTRHQKAFAASKRDVGTFTGIKHQIVKNWLKPSFSQF